MSACRSSHRQHASPAWRAGCLPSKICLGRGWVSNVCSGCGHRLSGSSKSFSRKLSFDARSSARKSTLKINLYVQLLPIFFVAYLYRNEVLRWRAETAGQIWFRQFRFTPDIASCINFLASMIIILKKLKKDSPAHHHEISKFLSLVALN